MKLILWLLSSVMLERPARRPGKLGREMDSFAKYLLTALICVVALGQFVQVITRYVLQIP